MKKTAGLIAIVVFAAAIFSIGFPAGVSGAADAGKFAVAYSGNIMGYFESCG
jgi:hypothetical protein